MNQLDVSDLELLDAAANVHMKNDRGDKAPKKRYRIEARQGELFYVEDIEDGRKRTCSDSEVTYVNESVSTSDLDHRRSCGGSDHTGSSSSEVTSINESVSTADLDHRRSCSGSYQIGLRPRDSAVASK